MHEIKIITGLAAVAASLAVQWVAAASGAWALSWIPYGVLAALWWQGRLALVPRTAFALLAGFFLDSMGPAPFGSSVIVLLILAGAREVLHTLFSARDSRVATLANAATLLALFFILMPLSRTIATTL